MSNLFIPKDTIQSVCDWIIYCVQEDKTPPPDFLLELEKCIASKQDNVTISVQKDLLQHALTWIHYERRATGKDRPQIETTLQNMLREVNRKEKSRTPNVTTSRTSRSKSRTSAPSSRSQSWRSRMGTKRNAWSSP